MRSISQLILVVALFALFAAFGQAQAQTRDKIFFQLAPAHSKNFLNSYFDGYITCERDSCPLTDILSVQVANSEDSSDLKPYFVEIDTYLVDGDKFSQARLNKTLALNQPSYLPMKTKRPLIQGETLYLSGEIQWHRVAFSETITVTFGYGASVDTLEKTTLQHPFFTPIEVKKENFQPLTYHQAVAPFAYDFTLYPQSPPFLTSSIKIFPFGGISPTPSAACTANSYKMLTTITFSEYDTQKKFPTITLTIPANNEQQYQSFQEETMVQIKCTGFVQPNQDIHHGLVTIFYPLAPSEDNIPYIQTSTSFGKSPLQQDPEMARTDGTITLHIEDYYSYTISRLDSNGNQKQYSYQTLHVELASPQLTLSSSKIFHITLDGIHGGSFSTSRWALTARDSKGAQLPYTVTGKLSVDWSLDGKKAELKTFTVELSDEMKERYDPTQGVTLSISYILSFDSTARLPAVLAPTVCIGIEQEVHWASFKTKSTVIFWELATPVLSRKAIVISDNFHFNAFSYSVPEGSPETPAWENEHAIDFVGQQRLFGFNASIANVQYLDFERPSYFSLVVPTREYNFGGDFSTCTINGNPVPTLNPLNPTEFQSHFNNQGVMFSYTLQPSVNYDLLCPHAFLTNSSRDSSDVHKNKEIIIEFVTQSSTPEVNEYTLIATSIVDFGDHHHDTGDVFALVTCITLAALFAAILVFIIVDRRRKAKKPSTQDNNVELSDSGPINNNGKPETAQYQQFSDQH